MAIAEPKAGSHRLLLKKDAHQISLVLGRFRENTGCKSVLLIDEAGHLIFGLGNETAREDTTITALIAGTFQTTRRLSMLLGSSEFSSRVDCGDSDLMLLQVGEDALLAVTMGEETTSTLVRTYALESIRRLDEVFKRAGGRTQEKAIEESGWKENTIYASAVTAKLDALFG